MGLIGREIVQSRAYDDVRAQVPDQNYRLTFPITVFDAVRLSMTDEESLTLMDALRKIGVELENRQPIFPGRPANFLMTFAGTPGEVGGIEISRDVPWDPAHQSHDRIPTEKAVGDLMFKLGLIDEDGKPINDPESKRVRWSDIIGRPMIYTETGDHEDGFMTQKAVTKLLSDLDVRFDEIGDLTQAKVDQFIEKLSIHIANHENPHGLTPAIIGAASEESLRLHIEETINPHNITAEMIGLGNVDNTADTDKPISKATQRALDLINEHFETMNNKIGDLDFVTGAEYNQESGKFTITFRSGDSLSLYIPINGLIDEIQYDPETKEIIFIEISGQSKRIDVSDLFIRYLGSTGPQIIVRIDGNNRTGDQTIECEIRSKSITAGELADGAIINRNLADKAVTGQKIGDLTVTTINIADGSITTEKINIGAVTNTRIASRAVNGRTLFSSAVKDRVLVTVEPGTDPLWSQVQNGMIADEAVTTEKIFNRSITTEKIMDQAVTGAKIAAHAITESLLAVGAVTNSILSAASVSSDKLASNLLIPGSPSIGIRPDASADDSKIPDTHWVRNHVTNYVATSANIGKKVVNGSHLFSSNVRDRILAVLRPNADPEWATINHDMLEDGIIYTANIKNLAITAPKIADKAIENRHLTDQVIRNNNIADSAVDTRTLFAGPGKGYILGSLDDTGKPVYSKVEEIMMAPNSISSMAIKDAAVLPAKLQSSTESHMVMAVTLRNAAPAWTKVTSQMIADRTITGKNMVSGADNTVLITETGGSDPKFGKINGNMVKDDTIGQRHLQAESVGSAQLKEKSVEGKHLAEWSIPGTALQPRSIQMTHLQTSPYPNRILAILDPYTDPVWSQMTTDMLADKSVTKEKLFQSGNPYRVLGVTQAGVPPEYLMITHHFIVDGEVLGPKIEPNVALTGTPEATIHPAEDSDNYQLATTKWVRKVVRDMCMSFIPTAFSTFREIAEEIITELWDSKGEADLSDIFDGDHDYFMTIDEILGEGDFHLIPKTSSQPHEHVSGVDSELYGSCTGGTTSDPCYCDHGLGILHFPIIREDMIGERAVTAQKLFSSSMAPRVLGITAPDADPEYLLVENAMIADGAVTTNKLQRSIHLLGSPILEVRPQPDASLQYGGGDLIPDCQWVLDRIADAIRDLNGGKKIVPLKEISAAQVEQEWITKGQTPDEPDEEEPQYTLDAPSTVQYAEGTTITVSCRGCGGSGSGTVDGKAVSDKVVTNIHNTAYNETSDGEKLPVSATDSSDYADASTPGSTTSTPTTGNTTCPLLEGLKVNSGGGSGPLLEGSVGTQHLMKRAVTLDKIASSGQPHVVLAVKDIGAGPAYMKIINEMMEDRVIDSRTLMSSPTDNRVLAVINAGADAQWCQITNPMMANLSVNTAQLYDRAVTHEKLATKAVDRRNLMDTPMIEEIHMMDASISTRKIQDRAVDKDKIAEDAVQGEHIVPNVELRGNPTVAANANYEKRSIRNIILSPNKPSMSGCKNGDIWFQYI